MKLVTVFSSNSPAQAEIARSRLDAAQFHPILTNEMAAFTPAFFSSAPPVRVQVPEEEAADAKALLSAAGDS